MGSRSAVAALALALTVLSACGSSDSGGSSGSTDDASTSLKIVVRTDTDAAAKTYTLTCDPAGGEHPQPQQACDVLAKAGAEVFRAVPDDQACTELYGGAQTATVTGTYDGRDVDASFSRINGCEVDRWDSLGTTFFAVPML